MSFDLEKLYALLPAIDRIRDAEQGEPLKALLSVIAEQVAVLEEDLAQQYDDKFIETCAIWAVPYLGDLIGYRQLHGVTSKVRSPRSEVANTIAYRRRKGTAAMLEQLARDVTEWDARVVEFFQLLATTQYLNHRRPTHVSTPDLRQWEPLERLNTPFDSLAHTADIRRIATSRGRYNIPNIGIFLWRLHSYSLTLSPAYKVDDQRYVFSPLGNDTALFTLPETEDEITHLAEPINVPMPIGRRILDAYLKDYYGRDKSLYLDGVDDLRRIVVCDLSDKNAAGTEWAHTPPEGKIAIDPVLGRIAFEEAQEAAPRVIFHCGFSGNMGGGEYDRASSLDSRKPDIVPSAYPTIAEALDAVSNTGGVVEVGDSGCYKEDLSVRVAASGGRIEFRAANRCRPTLVLSKDLLISGKDDGEVTLNGLLISGGRLRVVAGSDGQELKTLRLRHCTLVPGISLGRNGEPTKPSEPSLIVETSATSIEIDHSIVGGLRIEEDATVRITHSIVDATAESGMAYAGLDGSGGGGPLHVEYSTVIGKVHTVLMELASNSIFLATLAAGDPWSAPMISDRKQGGCVRFSYLPLDSRVPRRYRCQPESQAVATRVRPMFSSLHYGDPGYGQLRPGCAVEILQGADDEAEMGAFHDLYQPQRETNLRVRLDEYLRFGLEAGIFYSS